MVVINPNRAWFKTTLQERAAWFQNYNDKAQAEGLNYGLTQANLDQIKDDNNMMQFLASSFVAIDTYEKAWTAFRNGITTQPVGSAAFVAPDPLSLAVPTIPPTGIFQRVIDYRDVVIHSLNYTVEVGQSWGIEPTTANHIAPGDVKPTIIAQGAESDYHFSVIAGNRQDSDQWNVMVLRKGAAGWVVAKTATGKSIDVHLTPLVPGEPEQLQVRIQLLKGNADYGQVSDTVWITINP